MIWSDKPMEITYNFADGENVIVLVDEKLGSTIMQLSKDLYNNNHKETRRHQSLNEVLEKTIHWLMKTSISKKNF